MKRSFLDAAQSIASASSIESEAQTNCGWHYKFLVLHKAAFSFGTLHPHWKWECASNRALWPIVFTTLRLQDHLRGSDSIVFLPVHQKRIEVEKCLSRRAGCLKTAHPGTIEPFSCAPFNSNSRIEARCGWLCDADLAGCRSDFCGQIPF